MQSLNKIIYCFAKLGEKDPEYFQKLLGQMSVQTVQMLSEPELTSFLFSVSKLNLELAREFRADLFDGYTKKLFSTVELNSLQPQRIPYVLYALSRNCSQIEPKVQLLVKKIIIAIVTDKGLSLGHSEISTILYSLKFFNVRNSLNNEIQTIFL